jgi:cytochrome c biogenesis protein CcmG, thiol:disulfide interchange protein DsbE
MRPCGKNNRACPGARKRKAALLVLLMCFAALVCATPAPTSLLHKAAPAFTRNDLNGNRVNLRDYRGKVILLNFWATWCGPCRLELPRFAEWQKQYGPEGLQVISVSMDDSARPVRAFVHKLNLNYPVLLGDGKLGTRYGGILGLPVTFLIARDGRVSARMGEGDLPAMENRVKELLAQPEMLPHLIP